MAKNNRTPDRIQAVWNILGGEDGIDRLLAGELKVVEVHPREFPVWKTVKLGTCKTPGAYYMALKEAGVNISPLCSGTLDRITCSKGEIDLDLVALSVADLGLKEDARYTNICAKAQEFGLELCPAEVGPALRLQYGDQPEGEELRIAMKDLIDCSGDLDIFVVEHDGNGLLLYSLGCPDLVSNVGCSLVFIKPCRK